MQISEVRNRKEDILRLALNYGVKNIQIFGSVASGEQDSESDIDFLVEMEKGKSLLDRLGFKYELEKLLQKKVDVISVRALKERMRESVLKCAVQL